MNATYIIVEDKSSSELIKKVNAMLVAGWSPLGGIAFNADKGLYIQALLMHYGAYIID